MNHGISFVAINTQPLQQAIIEHASKDRISYLKQTIAYNATIGYQYDEVPFSKLSAILSNDYAFNPFKFKTLEEGAVYNQEAYPNPHGRIRGRANVTGKCTWVCLDIDDTTIADIDMHIILSKFNHHIARTSDASNPYKYRIILPLSAPIEVDNDHWKFFIDSIVNSLGLKVDRIPRSQLLIGYKGRKVYTTIGKATIEPSRHLKWAHTKVSELEEKRANAIPKCQADRALQSPLSTFEFAYESSNGEGTMAMLGAIRKAKELGATNEYIEGLLHSINNFWDVSMSEHRLRATVMSAI